MTVQGPTGAPVSVSVQVQGNEAHVAFRSEQPLARQMLGSALPQLEQLLGTSGLVLGQVSVGAGSAGREGAPAPQAAEAVKAIAGVPDGAAGASSTQAHRLAAGVASRRGGIDLYV